MTIKRIELFTLILFVLLVNEAKAAPIGPFCKNLLNYLGLQIELEQNQLKQMELQPRVFYQDGTLISPLDSKTAKQLLRLEKRRKELLKQTERDPGNEFSIPARPPTKAERAALDRKERELERLQKAVEKANLEGDPGPVLYLKPPK